MYFPALVKTSNCKVWPWKFRSRSLTTAFAVMPISTCIKVIMSIFALALSFEHINILHFWPWKFRSRSRDRKMRPSLTIYVQKYNESQSKLRNYGVDMFWLTYYYGFFSDHKIGTDWVWRVTLMLSVTDAAISWVYRVKRSDHQLMHNETEI